MNTNDLTHKAATNPLSNSDTNPHIAEKVGREILESRLDPATWATALSESGGNRQQAFAHYARMRIHILEKQYSNRLAKNDSFEIRRLKQCLGGRSVQPSIARSVRELIDGPRLKKPLNFVRPSLSPMWLAILCIGTAGTAATLGHLSAARLAEGIAGHLTMISAICGLSVVGVALILRRTLPKPWVMHFWDSGLVAACNLVCLCSLFLGTKIIKRALATDSAVFPIQQVGSAQLARNPQPETPRNQYLISTKIADASTPREY